MKSDINPYEKMLTEGHNSLRPEDIKAYGVQCFLDEQAKREPLPIPDLHCTEEENRIMDELLAAERLPTNESEAHEN